MDSCKMKIQKHLVGVLLLSVLAIIGMIFSILAQAAPITWAVSNITASDSDVSSNGTLVEARNGAPSPVIVNGVTFQGPNVVGNLFDSLFANDNISGRAGTLPAGTPPDMDVTVQFCCFIGMISLMSGIYSDLALGRIYSNSDEVLSLGMGVSSGILKRAGVVS